MSDNASPDISGIISSLMADERFASVLAGLGGSTPAQSEPDKPAMSPELAGKLPDIIAALSGGAKPDAAPSHADERQALLRALRPFMSERRKRAIDTITELGTVAGLARKL